MCVLKAVDVRTIRCYMTRGYQDKRRLQPPRARRSYEDAKAKEVLIAAHEVVSKSRADV